MTDDEGTGADLPPARHETQPATLRDALTTAYFAGWWARDRYPERDLARERVEQVLAQLGTDGDSPIT